MVENSNQPKIIIVEDEILVAKDIQSQLESFGYFVPCILNTGEEVIHAAGKYLPDLFLMDIILAGSIDGIEAALKVKNAYNISSIFLTGNANNDFIQRIKKVDPLGFIVKPFDSEELKANIEIGIHKNKKTQLDDKIINFFTKLSNNGNMIPICAKCKKIENGNNKWTVFEEYFFEKIGLEFTHGICPDCIREIYPEYLEIQESKIV